MPLGSAEGWQKALFVNYLSIIKCYDIICHLDVLSVKYLHILVLVFKYYGLAYRGNCLTPAVVRKKNDVNR